MKTKLAVISLVATLAVASVIFVPSTRAADGFPGGPDMECLTSNPVEYQFWDFIFDLIAL